MYMKEPGESTDNLPAASPLLQIAIFGSAIMTLVLGTMPGWVLDFATRASR
jgi:NADH:ubiquinone oxidoreductase subunit 2 (subunit N)